MYFRAYYTQTSLSEAEYGAIAFSSDGNYFANASDDKNVRVWNLQTGKSIHLLAHQEDVRCISLTENNDTVSGSSNSIHRRKSSEVYVWKLESGQFINSFDVSEHIFKIFNSLSISSVNHLAVTGCSSITGNGNIKFWNWKTGEQIKKVRAHDGGVCSLAISQDEKKLASGGKDEKIKAWHIDKDLDKGVNKETLDKYHRVIEDAHDGDILTLAISPDGKTLVSGGEDETIKVWDLETDNQQPQIIEGHAGEVWCVAVSPDSIKLASASADSTIKIWDLKTLERFAIEGHVGEVETVVFSPDSKTLASAGEDFATKIWQVDNLIDQKK